MIYYNMITCVNTIHVKKKKNFQNPEAPRWVPMTTISSPEKITTSHTVAITMFMHFFIVLTLQQAFLNTVYLGLYK